MILDPRSVSRLATVHPDLRAVVEGALERTPRLFIITEGVRTLERQRELFLAKKSKTMRSKHLPGTDGLARAFDFAIWEDKDEDKVVDVDELSWKFPLYKEVADCFKQVAGELGIVITWGGDWETFKDGPHIELPWGKLS